VYLLKNLLI